MPTLMLCAPVTYETDRPSREAIRDTCPGLRRAGVPLRAERRCPCLLMVVYHSGVPALLRDAGLVQRVVALVVGREAALDEDLAASPSR